MKKQIIWMVIVICSLLTVHAEVRMITTGGTNLNGGGVAIIGNAFKYASRIVVPKDITPPIIYNIQTELNNESANITWNTNEQANYTFRLSTGAEYENNTFIISFFQNLTGLQNGTLYSYNITACDISGNCNTTDNLYFITNNNPGYVFPSICTDQAYVNKSCTFISSTANCTEYIMYNSTGTKITNGTLTPLPIYGGYVHQFEFNQSKGEYIVNLCNTHFKDIKVVEDETMSLFYGLLILIPAIFGIAMLFGAFMLADEFWHLKLAMFLLFPFTIMSSLHFAVTYIVRYDPGFPAIQTLIGTTTNWIGWIVFIVFSYFAIWFIKMGFDYVKKKKQDKMEY